MLENNDLIDSSEQHIESTLKNSLFWWEKKRIIFNAFVGVCGAISLIFMESKTSLRIFVEIIIWAILVNLIYCFGFIFEVLDNYYLNKMLKTEKIRLILFIIGTTFICVITILANVYYDEIMSYL